MVDFQNNGRSMNNKRCPKLPVKINRGGKNENDSILPLQSYNLSRPFPLVFYRDRHSTPMTAYYYTAVHSTLRNLFRRGSWIISTNLRGFAWTRFLSSSKCSLQCKTASILTSQGPWVRVWNLERPLLSWNLLSKVILVDSAQNLIMEIKWKRDNGINSITSYQYSFKLLAFKSVLIQRDHFLCLRKPSSQFLISYLCFKVTLQIFCSYKLDFNQNIWKYEMNVNMSSWRIPSWPFVCKWHSWSSS